MMQRETSNSRAGNRAKRRTASTAAPLVAAAILLPPLALFLVSGVSRDFWLAFALTCLGYLPGVTFALFALLKSPARWRAA